MIDIEKALAPFVAERGERVGKILGERALLKRIASSRSMTDFRTFFAYFGSRDARAFLRVKDFPALFGAWWMEHLEKPHLVWLFDHMSDEADALNLVDRMLSDPRIDISRRALFYHAVFTAPSRTYFRRNWIIVLPPFWWDNRRVWQDYSAFVRSDNPDEFIRRLAVAASPKFKGSEAMLEAIRKDAVSVLEINRELDNRRVSDSLLQLIIRENAGRCFVYMLKTYPRQVFKLRSPEEWLLTVCRYAKNELGIAAVDELEREFPGIVGRTRDHWGDTPLWNTLFNANPTGKLQAELLRCGCDPDAVNDRRLSYRLVKDNSPEKLRLELRESRK